MQKKTIEELNEMYDLELDRIIKTINKEKAKRVLLQFPDGMKPYADVIAKYVEDNTKSTILIWMDSCFGACDLPLETKKLGIDLIVQFGHSDWGYKDKGIKVVK